MEWNGGYLLPVVKPTRPKRAVPATRNAVADERQIKGGRSTRTAGKAGGARLANEAARCVPGRKMAAARAREKNGAGAGAWV